jgi:hypothetical protein
MSRTLTSRVSKSRNVEMQNREMSKTPYQRFRYQELEMSRTHTKRVSKSRNAEMPKLQKALTAKFYFRSFRDHDMERQVISSRGMPKCRNDELRNGETSTRSIIFNPMV